jgi:hypothetical protein
VVRVGQQGMYEVKLLPLPALRPTRYLVEIVPPQGAVIQTAAPMSTSGTKARYEGSPVRPTALSVRVVAPS